MRKDVQYFWLYWEEGVIYMKSKPIKDARPSDFIQWLSLRWPSDTVESLDTPTLITELNNFRDMFVVLFGDTYIASKALSLSNNRRDRLSDTLQLLNNREENKELTNLIIRNLRFVPSYAERQENGVWKLLTEYGKNLGICKSENIIEVFSEILSIAQKKRKLPKIISYDEVVSLIAERDHLRSDKEYEKADYILTLLNTHGIEVSDTSNVEVSLDQRWNFSP